MSFQTKPKNTDGKKIVQVNGVMQVSVKDLRKEFQKNEAKQKSVTNSRRASKKVANIAGYFGTLAGSDKKCFGGAPKYVEEASEIATDRSIVSQKSQKENSTKSAVVVPSPLIRSTTNVSGTSDNSIRTIETNTGMDLSISSNGALNDQEQSFLTDCTEKSWSYSNVKLRKVQHPDRNGTKNKHFGKQLLPSKLSVVGRRMTVSESTLSMEMDSRDDSSSLCDSERRQTFDYIPRNYSKSARPSTQECASKSATKPTALDLKTKDQRVMAETSGIKMTSFGIDVSQDDSVEEPLAHDKILLQKPVTCRTPSATEKELQLLRSMALTKKSSYQSHSRTSSSFRLESPRSDKKSMMDRIIVGARDVEPSPEQKLVPSPMSETSFSAITQISEPMEGADSEPSAKTVVKKSRQITEEHQTMDTFHPYPSNELERVRMSLRSVRLPVVSQTDKPHVQHSNSVPSPKENHPSMTMCKATKEDSNDNRSLCSEISRSTSKTVYGNKENTGSSKPQNWPEDPIQPAASMQSDYTTDTDYSYGADGHSQSENHFLQITLSSGGIAEKYEPNIVMSPTDVSIEGMGAMNLGGHEVVNRASWSHNHPVPLLSPTGSSPERYHDGQSRSRDAFRGAKHFFFRKKSSRKSNLF